MPTEPPAAIDPQPPDLKARIAAVERAIGERDAELRAEREREAMFRTIVENLDRVFWIITPDQSRMIYLSPATERILGRSRASIYADTRSWIAAIHPDDRERVLAAVAARLSGQIPDPRYTIFRVVRPDDTIRWLRSSGVVVTVPERGEWYVGIAEDVTELKLAADAESEREALLRLMAEQLPAVIWTTDRDLVFMSSTGRGLADIGRAPNEVLGMRLADYFATEDPDFPPIAAHRRALAGEAVTYEGHWAGRAFESHVEPLRDATGRTIGVLGLALDVTDRNRAEAAARESHESLKHAHEELNEAHGELERLLDHLELRVAERTAELRGANEELKREVAERMRADESLQRSVDLYRLLAENATDGIARFDVNGRYQYVSPAYRNILGFAPEELIGLANYKLVHPDDLQIVALAHQEVLAGSGRVTVSFRLAHKAGSYRWVEVNARRVAEDGGACREIVSVMRDVSERKAVEERLKRLQDELAHAARLSTLGEMASGLAHELDQPLTAVLNYLDAGRRLLSAERTVMPPALGGALEEAMAEAARAGRIIHQWRAFARRGETERRAEDVNRLVQAVVELAAADVRVRRVKVELDLGAELPAVRADAVQVQQVILNLLRNAWEAMGEGSEGERRITVRTQVVKDGEVEVAVSDTGRGLTAAERKRLFEPFYTTKESGMGLGLPISRSIVEAHGGRLWADAEPADRETMTGATFRFTLAAMLPGGES